MAVATQPERTERWVILSTVLASSMAFIDSTALRVALPALQRDLNVTGSQLIWVENAYTLFLSALILFGGSLGDRYGRKRIFTLGILVFAAASFACGLAPTIDLLILARAAQGIGGALMVPGSLALITALVAPARRGRAIGTWSTFSTMTTLVGPLLGGQLAAMGLWRAIFFINLPLAAFALYLLVIYVPENRGSAGDRRLDVVGALLITLGLAGLTFGFTEAPGRGLADPLIAFTLGGGVLALIAFVIVEARSAHALMPLSLFRSRTFAGTNLLTLFLYAALSVLPFFLVLNLQQVQGYSETFSGFTLLPLGILLTLMSRWAGGLMDRVGARLPLTIGPLLAGVGFALFGLPGLTGGESDYWLTYFPATVMLGVGMGITVAPLTTAVMGAAPGDMVGTASGINNAVARTAGVLAIAILGAISLSLFATALDTRTQAVGLSADQQAALQQEAGKLAEAQPPANLSADQMRQVEAAIEWAFIDIFRVVAGVSAALAWISALMGWLLVEGKRAAADSPGTHVL